MSHKKVTPGSTMLVGVGTTMFPRNTKLETKLCKKKCEILSRLSAIKQQYLD